MDKLRQKIPDKATRILIYCNNNFDHTPIVRKGTSLLDRNVPDLPPVKVDEDNEEIITGTTVKLPSLALNIPTFINPWIYGYQNIYELADSVPVDDSRLRLEGKAILAPSRQP